jgi:hypothetical protein
MFSPQNMLCLNKSRASEGPSREGLGSEGVIHISYWPGSQAGMAELEESKSGSVRQTHHVQPSDFIHRTSEEGCTEINTCGRF